MTRKITGYYVGENTQKENEENKGFKSREKRKIERIQ
jgi:hypothetical protein